MIVKYNRLGYLIGEGFSNVFKNKKSKPIIKNAKIKNEPAPGPKNPSSKPIEKAANPLK